MVTIREGDLLASDCEVICHQTNCKGAMGRGVAACIRSVYPEAYQALRGRFERGEAMVGEVDFVPTVRDGVLRYIVNCYGQNEYFPRGVVHTDYLGLRRCFQKIKFEFKDKDVTIGFPYNIGCGLAGGDWDVVSKIIEEEFGGEEWRVELWRLKS